MQTITHEEQQSRSDKEHQQPKVLPQMDSVKVQAVWLSSWSGSKLPAKTRTNLAVWKCAVVKAVM